MIWSALAKRIVLFIATHVLIISAVMQLYVRG